ncbi:unnamed protein product [Urochloa humidicola]
MASTSSGCSKPALRRSSLPFKQPRCAGAHGCCRWREGAVLDSGVSFADDLSPPSDISIRTSRGVAATPPQGALPGVRAVAALVGLSQVIFTCAVSWKTVL